jgi:ribosome-binding factor A
MSRRPSRAHRAAGPRTDRKTLQLCSQVAEALQLILLGECDDDVLRELMVDSVVPAPNASQLLVTFSSTSCTSMEKVAEALKRLHQAAGFLRSEVAMSIHRRKAPELLFRIELPQRGEAAE